MKNYKVVVNYKSLNGLNALYEVDEECLLAIGTAFINQVNCTFKDTKDRFIGINGEDIITFTSKEIKEVVNE